MGNTIHIHLDPLGGIAGDMFAAAMLDAFPHLEQPLWEVLHRLEISPRLKVSLQAGQDKGLCGKRFMVEQEGEAAAPAHHHHHSHDHHDHDHGHGHHTHGHDAHGHGHVHEHHSWREIRKFLEAAVFSPAVRDGAIGIFTLLAEAEARIHGVAVADVQFHEVGAWDCIADIIAAAFLIHHSGAASWSVSSLPWGGGVQKCAHGIIPVPAPATLHLLGGMPCHDDGEKGERVTPTGAAILAYLSPASHLPRARIRNSGYGFGTRKLSQRANALRVCVLSCDAPDPAMTDSETITMIQCDIDDMSPEMLAIACEQMRQCPEVIDLATASLMGKKGRMMTQIQILCRPEHFPTVRTLVFQQTSTIGLRFWECQRSLLPREAGQVEMDGHTWPVKRVTRPDGTTSSKIEADSLTCLAQSHQQRDSLKQRVEQETAEGA